MNIVITSFLLLLSAWFDAKGFLYASQSWTSTGELKGKSATLTVVYFVIGISLYLLSVRFMTLAGTTETTPQTLGWFFATIVGVAFMSGEFQKWAPLQIASFVLVVLGMAYLLAASNH